MNTEDAWAAYARTVVEISPRARATLRIFPAPKGEVGTWPLVFKAEIFVITAWNPHSQPLDEKMNRVRQEELEAELLSLEHCPAVGLDPSSEYREEGVAVSGLSEIEAINLGARYDQSAIFAWTPAAWRILSCVDERREEAGWLVVESGAGVRSAAQPIRRREMSQRDPARIPLSSAVESTIKDHDARDR